MAICAVVHLRGLLRPVADGGAEFDIRRHGGDAFCRHFFTLIDGHIPAVHAAAGADCDWRVGVRVGENPSGRDAAGHFDLRRNGDSGVVFVHRTAAARIRLPAVLLCMHDRLWGYDTGQKRIFDV